MNAFDIFLKKQRDLKAYDGDTLYGVEGNPDSFDSSEGLRINGIDTPEMKGRYGRPQYGAQAALDTARKYETDATTVTNGLFSHDRGYYGRRLGDRKDAAGRLLSHELLARGQAVAGTSSTSQQRAIESKLELDVHGLGLNPATEQQKTDYDTRRVNQQKFIDDLEHQDFGISLKRKSGLHSDAIARGADQVQQMGYGVLKLVGDMFGSDGISKLAKSGIDQQSLELMLNPRHTKSFTESDGFAKSIASVYESVIEQLPNIGTTLAMSLATGGIGGLATRSAVSRIAAGELAANEATVALFKNAVTAAPFSSVVNHGVKSISGFATGAKFGAGIGGVGMNTGETKVGFDEEGVDNNSLALFTGMVKGALDVFGLSKIPGFNRLMGMGARASKIPVKKLWRDVPFEVLKAAGAEGTTEAFQQVADELALGSQKPDHEFDWDSVLESFVVGAAASGAMAIPGSSAEVAFQKTPVDDLGDPIEDKNAVPPAPPGAPALPELPPEGTALPPSSPIDPPSSPPAPPSFSDKDLQDKIALLQTDLDKAHAKNDMPEILRLLDEMTEAAALADSASESSVDDSQSNMATGSVNSEAVAKMRAEYMDKLSESFIMEHVIGVINDSPNSITTDGGILIDGRPDESFNSALRRGLIDKDAKVIKTAAPETSNSLADPTETEFEAFLNVATDSELIEESQRRSEIEFTEKNREGYSPDALSPDLRKKNKARIARIAAYRDSKKGKSARSQLVTTTESKRDIASQFSLLKNNLKAAVFVADESVSDTLGEGVTIPEDRTVNYGVNTFKVAVNGDQKGYIYFRSREAAKRFKEEVDLLGVDKANFNALGYGISRSKAEVLRRAADGDPAVMVQLQNSDDAVASRFTDDDVISVPFEVLANQSNAAEVANRMAKRLKPKSHQRIVTVTAADAIESRAIRVENFEKHAASLRDQHNAVSISGSKSAAERELRVALEEDKKERDSKLLAKDEKTVEQRTKELDIDVHHVKNLNGPHGVGQSLTRMGLDPNFQEEATDPDETLQDANRRDSSTPTNKAEMKRASAKREAKAIAKAKLDKARKTKVAKKGRFENNPRMSDGVQEYLDSEKERLASDEESVLELLRSNLTLALSSLSASISTVVNNIGQRSLNASNALFIGDSSNVGSLSDAISNVEAEFSPDERNSPAYNSAIINATKDFYEERIGDGYSETLKSTFPTMSALEIHREIQNYMDKVLPWRVLRNQDDAAQSYSEEDTAEERKIADKRRKVNSQGTSITTEDAFDPELAQERIHSASFGGGEFSVIKSRTYAGSSAIRENASEDERIQYENMQDFFDKLSEVERVSLKRSIEASVGVETLAPRAYRHSGVEHIPSVSSIPDVGTSVSIPEDAPKLSPAEISKLRAEILASRKAKLAAEVKAKEAEELTKAQEALRDSFGKGRFQSMQRGLENALRALLKKGGGSHTILKADLMKLFDKLLPAPMAKIYKQIFGNAPDNLHIILTESSSESGSFNAETGTINLGVVSDKSQSQRKGWYGESLLHELIHAVTLFHSSLADMAIQEFGLEGASVSKLVDAFKAGTLNNIKGEQLAALKELMAAKGYKSIILADRLLAIFKAFKSKNGDALAASATPSANLASVAEFIATANSNAALMEILNNMEGLDRSKNGLFSLIENLFDAIREYFGIAKKGLLYDVLSVTENLASDNSRVSGVNQKNVQIAVAASRKAKIANISINKILTIRERMPLNKITSSMRGLFSKEGSFAALKSLKTLLTESTKVVHPVIMRTRRLSRELADHYTSGPGRGSLGYLQNYEIDSSLMRARLHESAFAGRDEASIEAGLLGAMNGDFSTPVAKGIKTFLASFDSYLATSSVARIAAIGKDNRSTSVFGEAHNIEAIRADREGFVKFLLSGNNGGAFRVNTGSGQVKLLTKDAALNYVEGLLRAHVPSGQPHVRAPGLKKPFIADPAYQAAAGVKGFINTDPKAVLEFYITTMTRQKNYEEAFGDWVPAPMNMKVKLLQRLGYFVGDSNTGGIENAFNDAVKRGYIRRISSSQFSLWNPDLKRSEAIAKVGETSGQKAVEELQMTLNSMDGLLGLDLDPKTRSLMQWVAVAQSVILLAFNMITSIPEHGIMLATAIAKSPSATFKGWINFMKNPKQAMAFAASMGSLPQYLMAGAYMDGSRLVEAGNMSRQTLETFFKYNLNTLFNNMNRSVMHGIGIEYFSAKADFINNKQGTSKEVDFAIKELERWGTSASQIKKWVDGGKKPIESDGSVSHMAGVLLQFVDSGSANPTPASKAAYGNDPKWMLIHQFKSFFYSYAQVIIPELAKSSTEAYFRAKASDKATVLAGLHASLPLIAIGAVAMPLAVVSQEIKASIRGIGDDEYDKRRKRFLKSQSEEERFLDILRASGALGPLDLMMSFYDAEEFGQSGVVRALGPTAGHLETLWRYGPFAPESLKRSIPVLGVTSPGLFRDAIKAKQKERRDAKKKTGYNN